MCGISESQITKIKYLCFEGECSITDNEIIKALLTVAYGGHSCNKCKHKLDKGEVRCGLMGCKITREAHDLINRQKAEIERLKDDLEYYQKGCHNLCKELDAEKTKNF